MSFTEVARRLAGQAGLLLGWQPDAFWRATPDELETALSALAAVAGGTDDPVSPDRLARLKEMYPDG